MIDLHKEQTPINPNFPLPEGSGFNSREKLENLEIEAEKGAKEPALEEAKQRAVDENITISKEFKQATDEIRRQPDSVLLPGSNEEQRNLLYKILSGDANEFLNGMKVSNKAEELQDFVNEANSGE